MKVVLYWFAKTGICLIFEACGTAVEASNITTITTKLIWTRNRTGTGTRTRTRTRTKAFFLQKTCEQQNLRNNSSKATHSWTKRKVQNFMICKWMSVSFYETRDTKHSLYRMQTVCSFHRLIAKWYHQSRRTVPDSAKCIKTPRADIKMWKRQRTEGRRAWMEMETHTRTQR